MPIYEYRCGACGHRLEVMQKMSESPLADCPECGKPDLQKLISASAFQLKGSGWYVTDFRDKKKNDVKPDGKQEDKGKTGDTAAGGTDGTPASAGDTAKAAAKE